MNHNAPPLHTQPGPSSHRFRTIPDVKGNPVLASCENCHWCIDQSDGPEYGPAWYACEKKGRTHMSNLKGFPFKTGMACCELSVAYTRDWSKP